MIKQRYILVRVINIIKPKMEEYNNFSNCGQLLVRCVYICD